MKGYRVLDAQRWATVLQAVSLLEVLGASAEDVQLLAIARARREKIIARTDELADAPARPALRLVSGGGE